MPQTGQAEYQKQIEIRAVSAFPVASQRDVHIFPKPGRQRNVPPAPEFCNRSGKIGVIKVFHKPEPKHPSKADCHIGISGKVKINLQRI